MAAVLRGAGDLDVSRETRDRLTAFMDMAQRWSAAINLVSRATLGDMWNRHILDSAQIFDLVPRRADVWADLGAGGGFPGLVVAAISAEHAPGRRVVLVESDQRKATFLRQAIATLGLTAARVEVARIEDLPPLEADVVSARALAPLDRLCGFAERHMLATGTALFPKGAGHLAELDAARVHWRFSETLHPSKTDPAAAIVELKELSRV